MNKQLLVPALVTVAAGLVLAALRRPIRFIGDRAEPGDQVVVPSGAVRLPLGLALPNGAGALVLEVVGADSERVEGPAVAYDVMGRRVPMPDDLRRAIGPVEVQRAGISAVYRGGKALTV
jgi:hypothetical protein